MPVLDESSFDLAPLMRPRSIAVVGATDTPGRFGARVMNNLRTWGFDGTIYPVNPGRQTVMGLPCFPSLRALPDPADTAVVAVPREQMIGVMHDAAAGGVRSLVVFTSGFADSGSEGAQLQAELEQLARRHSLPVVGPNCMGVINWWSRSALYSGDMSAAPPSGGIGMLSQSGSVAMTLIASGRPIGLACAVSSGNEAVLTAEDFLAYMLEDPHIRTIGCFLEQVRRPARFARLARRAQEVGKPIVALKVGTSEKGKAAAAAHTSALAGSDRVLDAFFRQCGVIRVRDLDELLATVHLLSLAPLPSGRGVGGIAVSGGEIALALDLGEQAGLEFPALAPETRAAFAQVHPLFTPATNPVDVWGLGASGPEEYARYLQILAGDPQVHTLLVWHDSPTHQSAALPMSEAAVQVAGSVDKPVVFMTGPSGYRNPAVCNRLTEHGLPFLEGAWPALKAISHLSGYAERRRRPEAGEGLPDAGAGKERAMAILNRRRTGLNEADGYELLAAYGVRAARHRVCQDAATACVAAAELGYPVVLKALSPQLAHKSETGAVALNLRTPQEVTAAYDQVLTQVSRRAPHAAVDGVLVQEMVIGGVECILGVSWDEQFGSVLLFGLGGIFVEVLRDTSLRVLPVTRADVEAMIREVKGFPLLSGARGRSPADLAALADALLSMAGLARDFPGLQIEVNPAVVLPEGRGLVALDALVSPDS